MNLSTEHFSQILKTLTESPAPQPTVPQKRRAPRVEHRSSVVITHCNPNAEPAQSLRVAQSLGGSHGGAATLQGHSMTVTVRNVSSRGIGILHPRALKTGDQFTLKMSREGGQAVSILCSVARCERIHDTLFAIGAEFTCVLKDTETPLFSASEENEAQRIRASMLG
jgi:hypothetical protein